MIIKGQKARCFVNSYKNIVYPLRLSDVYKSPSEVKRIVWDYCERKAVKMHGRRLTVLAYNSFRFTAAFEYDDPVTGVLMLHVETPQNSYDMEM